MLIEGEAGIGKSSVIAALLAAGLPDETDGCGHLLFGRAEAATKSQVASMPLDCRIVFSMLRYAVRTCLMKTCASPEALTPSRLPHKCEDVERCRCSALQVLFPWRQVVRTLCQHDLSASADAISSRWSARCRERISDYEVRMLLARIASSATRTCHHDQ